MSKRVFEFAKEIGATSKDVLDRCKKLGHSLPSQLTVIEDAVQNAVRRDMGLISEQAPPVATATAPASAPAAPPRVVSAAPVPRDRHPVRVQRIRNAKVPSSVPT
jgi:hypothetical protein